MTSPISSPNVGDFNSAGWADLVALAIDDNESAYTIVTPVLTASGTAPNLGSGGGSGTTYRKWGGPTTPRMCSFSTIVSWTSGFAAGTGNYFVNVPVAYTSTDGISPLFLAKFLSSAGNHYSMIGEMTSATTVAFYRGDGTANLLSATYPVVPAIGNTLWFGGTYRIG